MALALARPTPGIERVVHHQPVPSISWSSAKAGRQAQRDRQEARGLRREVGPAGIGAAHDGRELVTRAGSWSSAVFGDEGVEAAQLADMGELDIGHVVGRGAVALGDLHRPAPAARTEIPASRSMNRATSQGQAMRSIFGRSRVTHFMASSPLVGRHQRHGRAADRVPGGHAAGERAGIVAEAAQLGRRLAADLETVDAGDDQAGRGQSRGRRAKLLGDAGIARPGSCPTGAPHPRSGRHRRARYPRRARDGPGDPRRLFSSRPPPRRRRWPTKRGRSAPRRSPRRCSP